MNKLKETDISLEEMQEIIDMAESMALTSYEIDFVEDMTKKFGKYGIEMYVSDSQIQWLKNIGSKK